MIIEVITWIIMGCAWTLFLGNFLAMMWCLINKRTIKEHLQKDVIDLMKHISIGAGDVCFVFVFLGRYTPNLFGLSFICLSVFFIILGSMFLAETYRKYKEIQYLKKL